MATIRKSAARTKPRVDTEESAGRVPKSAAHRGSVTALSNGNIEIAYQASELVPVAQYANVTIGPVQLRWQTNDPGMLLLAGVDWDEDELTPAQQQVYDAVRGMLRATSKLVEDTIAEDREIVEASVRMMNEREAAEEEAKKKSSSRRRR